MKYIDKIKQMSADELAKSLKTLTDLLIENAISQLAERQGTHIDLKCFKDFTNIEDFKYCLESEVTMPMNDRFKFNVTVLSYYDIDTFEQIINICGEVLK